MALAAAALPLELADAVDKFDEILNEERTKQAAFFQSNDIITDGTQPDEIIKIKDEDSSMNEPPIRARRSFRRSTTMSAKERVSFRIHSMLRKRSFRRRNSSTSKGDEASSFTISDESVPDHLPEKVADSIREKNMGQYVIPPREKRQSYFDLYQ